IFTLMTCSTTCRRRNWLLRFVLRLAPCLAAMLVSQAATFTSDTAIGINNTNFDGGDIVECSIEILFASDQLMARGVRSFTVALGTCRWDVSSLYCGGDAAVSSGHAAILLQ